MLNLFLFLTFLICVGITGAWIAENPGNVTIYWFDYRVDTSFAVVLLVALLTTIALTFTYNVFRRLMLAPEYISNSRRMASYEKGLVSLTQSVAALAASCPEEAAKYARKAEKQLGRTPLTLLLSAQVAKSQGDETKTKVLLTHMLEHKETEYLAARSLSDFSRKHDAGAALALAQRALAINSEGLSRVVSLHLRLHHWQEALRAVDKASGWWHGIPRAEKRRYKGLIYLEQAMHLQHEGQSEAALLSARQALKLLPEFSPTVAFAAALYAAHKQQNKAISLITKQWKKAPDSTLAEAFRTSIVSSSQARQLVQARKLAGTRPQSIESDIILAEVALASKDWNTARKAIKSAFAKQETPRVCNLMATLEQSEYADFDSSHEWRARAFAATPDPAWHCSHCIAESKTWSVHCPRCDSFDTLRYS